MRVADSEQVISIAGGRIRCRQCNAKSKRSGVRCKSPAIRGKMKCLRHGGASTGPRTDEGKKRCAEAKTIHGWETRKMRNERKVAFVRLAKLELEARAMGLIVWMKNCG